MKIKSNFMTILLLSLILIYNYIYFVYISDVVTMTGGMSFRYDRIFLIVIICFMLVYTIKNYKIRLHSRYDPRKWLLVFLLIYLFYAILALDNLERVFSYYTTIMYVCLSFCCFFYLAYFSKIKEKFFLYFFVVFAGIATIAFYRYLNYKIALLGDNYFLHGNNTGFLFVGLIPATLFLFRKKKVLMIIIISIFMLLTAHSAKRGAIIIVGVLGLYTFFNSVNSFSKFRKIAFSLFLIIVLGCLIYYLQLNSELFIRFNDEGGSGRNILYSAILNHWINGDILQLLFGSGFFSTIDIAGGLMAHSDWLQVLSDMGIFGVIIYTFLILSFVVQRPVIKKYNISYIPAFDACMIFWLLKSTASGFFMDKGIVLIMITLGIILGFTYQRKQQNIVIL